MEGRTPRPPSSRLRLRGNPPGETALTRMFDWVQSKGRCLRQANRSVFAGGVSSMPLKPTIAVAAHNPPNSRYGRSPCIASRIKRIYRFPFQLTQNCQLTHRTVQRQDFPDFWVLGGLRANRTLLHRAGRIIVHRECRQWQHSIPLQPAPFWGKFRGKFCSESMTFG
jgi:hypothetical protein